MGQKGSQADYTLAYTKGDIIHYRLESGIYTTIITDTPSESMNYEVEFVAYTNLDEKNSSEPDTDLWRNSGAVGQQHKSSSRRQSDGNGSNSSGFNGRSGGYRYDPGGFTTPGEYACLWTSTENNEFEAIYKSLGFDKDGVGREYVDNGVGFSVRCIKD